MPVLFQNAVLSTIQCRQKTPKTCTSVICAVLQPPTVHSLCKRAVQDAHAAECQDVGDSPATQESVEGHPRCPPRSSAAQPPHCAAEFTGLQIRACSGSHCAWVRLLKRLKTREKITNNNATAGSRSRRKGHEAGDSLGMVPRAIHETCDHLAAVRTVQSARMLA